MLPSLLWLRENEPDRYERIRHVMLPKDYLRLRMTGEAASEYSDASATLLFDMKHSGWSDEILTAFDLPKEILPEIHEATEVAGQLTDSAAQEMGLEAWRESGVPGRYCPDSAAEALERAVRAVIDRERGCEQ